ncbi:MAG: fibronectin type III domain-containing protein [Planctomycetaceae bacterium]
MLRDYGITGLWGFGRDLFVGGRPVLLNSDVGAGSSVTFNWSPVEGAFEYRLQIDRPYGAQSRVVRENSLFSTTWKTSFALSGGTYRAWVQAVSSSGEQSPWSRAIDFVVT